MNRLAGKEFVFVAVQAVLFVLYFFRYEAFDFSVNNEVRYAGVLMAVFSAFLIAPALIELRKSLTPFPAPRENALLVTTGIYKYVRHPIYVGILLITIGYGFYSENGLRILISQVLILLFFLKARYEETLLLQRFPEYEDYRAKTACFIPGIY